MELLKDLPHKSMKYFPYLKCVQKHLFFHSCFFIPKITLEAYSNMQLITWRYEA